MACLNKLTLFKIDAYFAQNWCLLCLNFKKAPDHFFIFTCLLLEVVCLVRKNPFLEISFLLQIGKIKFSSPKTDIIDFLIFFSWLKPFLSHLDLMDQRFQPSKYKSCPFILIKQAYFFKHAYSTILKSSEQPKMSVIDISVPFNSHLHWRHSAARTKLNYCKLHLYFITVLRPYI